MSDLHARHEVQQSGGAVVPAGTEAADQARTARAEAMRSGDRAAVEKFDREERVALGGAPEGVPAGGVVEDGPPDASLYGIAAARFERTERGSYFDLVQDWGAPDSREFRESFDLSQQLGSELSAKFPALDDVLETATFEVDGEARPLRDHPAVARMMGFVARRLSELQQAGPTARKGTTTMQRGSGASSVADRIDAVRAEKRLAQAEGNRRRVSELDEAERRLWEQAGHVGPPVGQGGRLY